MQITSVTDVIKLKRAFCPATYHKYLSSPSIISRGNAVKAAELGLCQHHAVR